MSKNFKVGEFLRIGTYIYRINTIDNQNDANLECMSDGEITHNVSIKSLTNMLNENFLKKLKDYKHYTTKLYKVLNNG